MAVVTCGEFKVRLRSPRHVRVSDQHWGRTAKVGPWALVRGEASGCQR